MGLVGAINKLLTLKCREASILMSASMDDPLPAVDRWALRLHMMVCTACRRYRRQLRMMRRVLHEATKAAEQGVASGTIGLSADARRRLQDAIEREGA